MFKQGNEPGSSSKAKISLIGIRRQKSGRYAAVITDRIRHKKLWLGTFDTIEEASQAYFSKKTEFENEELTRIFRVHKKKKRGKYNYEITSPISKKRIWLGTIDNVKEASRVNKSKKKLEFKAMQQQCTNKNTEIDVVDSHEIGNGEVASRLFNSGLTDNVRGTKSSDECNITTSCDPKDKISLIGIRRRKSGRYAAVITDPIKHKSVCLGTFDTIEEASHAYFSKKSEFEKLSRQGNQENKPKKNCEQIQQPESPSVVESLNTAASCDPKARRSLIGIRRRKSGRYAAVITDPIRHKEVCLGTFDTIEEASQVYLSKKSEFEKLRQQGNKENCDQIQQPESLPVVTSLDTAASASGRDKIIDSHKTMTHIIGVNKSRTTGRYTSRITNPITKKKIWLGTFDTAEEASHAYQSKKNEFQKLVEAKQQQCTNKQTHSKQDAWDEKSVNVKQGHENGNCEPFLPESSGGSPEVDVPLSNSSDGGTVQSINSDKIGITEEDFHAYQSKKFDSQSSKEVELQRNMSTDSSAGEKQESQEDDEDLWMGEWVQLPDDRSVKFSLKLGLPIIDNYGYLLGEFSSLDDLSICAIEDDNQTSLCLV